VKVHRRGGGRLGPWVDAAFVADVMPGRVSHLEMKFWGFRSTAALRTTMDR